MKIEVYCDESRAELFYNPPVHGGFVLLGGLWMPSDQRVAMKARITELRERHTVLGEFKWNRVSPSKLGFYLDLVDFFFDVGDSLRFRCIVLAANEMDVVKFHGGDQELMFYKFYYQLIRHWLQDQNEYSVFVDAKTTRLGQRLQVLHNALKQSNLGAEVIRVQALPSHEVDLIQAADLFIGATGYVFNKEDGSEAKKAVVERIGDRLGYQIGSTTKNQEKYNVFRFQPQGEL